MKNIEFAAKTDNLESQFKERTHLIASLLKGQNPTSLTEESDASSQDKEKPSPLRRYGINDVKKPTTVVNPIPSILFYPFIIGNHEPSHTQSKGPQKEHPHKPKESE